MSGCLPRRHPLIFFVAGRAVPTTAAAERRLYSEGDTTSMLSVEVVQSPVER